MKTPAPCQDLVRGRDRLSSTLVNSFKSVGIAIFPPFPDSTPHPTAPLFVDFILAKRGYPCLFWQCCHGVGKHPDNLKKDERSVLNKHDHARENGDRLQTDRNELPQASGIFSIAFGRKGFRMEGLEWTEMVDNERKPDGTGS